MGLDLRDKVLPVGGVPGTAPATGETPRGEVFLRSLEKEGLPGPLLARGLGITRDQGPPPGGAGAVVFGEIPIPTGEEGMPRKPRMKHRN